MAIRRRSLVVRPERGARRETSWDSGPETGTNGGEQQVTAAGTTVWTTAVVPVVEGATVVRTRGYVELRMVSIGTVGDGFNGALGLILVSNQAAAAGAAAIPRPFTDMNNEGWFWHQLFSLHPESTTVEQNASMSLVFEIDSKAMRKFPVGLTMVGVIEAANEVGAASMAMYGTTRVLVKLS